MMDRRYWENKAQYAQPDDAQLSRNVSATMRKGAIRGKHMDPVIIEGKLIVKSWWGKAWCENLERYADFENRLARGKRYVRMNTVVDLQIHKGKVSARVQGRRKTPYKVEVRISPISEQRCQAVIAKCGQKIDNLEKLLNGDFPTELKDVFLSEDGLFPAQNEISFQCSCPDWALMCKHVAAVLYGIGARFDEDPLLFFALRGIEVDRFVDITLANKLDDMLANADAESERIITADDWEELFGL